MPRGLKVKFMGRTMQEFARRYLTDISASGMFVRTTDPLPVGTRVTFELRLEDDSLLLDGEAVVLWKAEESPELNLPAGMELRFDSFGPGSEARFHWLQMERRGVTVGREAPLSITATEPQLGPPAGAQPEHDDGARKRDTLPGRPEPEMPQARPSQQPALAGEIDGLQAQTTTPFFKPGGGPEAVPTVELPLAPASHALVRAPSQKLTVSKQRVAKPAATPEEPLPGDSDPGRLFHEVAKTDSFLAEEQGEPLPIKQQATVLVDWEEQARKRTWKAYVAVGLVVSVVGLAVVYLATSSRPEVPPQPPPAERFQRIVELSSTPEQAQVLLDGKSVGQTPLEVPVGKSPRLELRHSGFKPRQVAIAEEDPAWKPRGSKLVLALQVELSPEERPAEQKNPDAGAGQGKAATQPPAAAARSGSLSRRGRRQSRPAADKAQPAADVAPASGGAEPQPPAPAEDIAVADQTPSVGEQPEPSEQPASSDQPPAQDKPIKEPSWVQKDKPKADPADKPRADPADKPKADPADKPKADPADKPKADPADKPKADPEQKPPAVPPAKEPPEQPDPGGPLKKPSWIGG